MFVCESSDHDNTRAWYGVILTSYEYQDTQGSAYMTSDIHIKDIYDIIHNTIPVGIMKETKC